MNTMQNKYTIGLDFGSLSCRGILACVHTGEILTEYEYVYPHGVISDTLPDGTKLPPLWALQHPQDYIDALFTVIPMLISCSGIDATEIIGIGIDTTASSVLPVDAHFMPLALDEEFRSHPHAWLKMWKHHAAWREAQELTEIARANGLNIVEKYGGAIGAEFMLPKVLQVMREDRTIFDAAWTFMELGDWLTSLLTGHEVRSGSMLTCKAMWTKECGWPTGEPFDSLRCRLPWRNGSHPVCVWPGESAGTVACDIAARIGLSEKTAVSAAQMDAYAGLPGCGINRDGVLMMIIGTSTGYMLLDRKCQSIPGICASVEDSNIPGYTNYAAGQASVGDIFGWFVKNCIPEAYVQCATANGQTLHGYLETLASQKKPGETGLLALDWWNGNKSILADSQLSGMILGMTLATQPEDIYRALIEATAFGARKIVDNFEQHGLKISEIVACGGIAIKNQLLMQIYSDVLNKPVTPVLTGQTAALGAAMLGASASGVHKSLVCAIEAMAPQQKRTFYPEQEYTETYEKLYSEYLTLHDYFGRGANDVMKRLKEMQK